MDSKAKIHIGVPNETKIVQKILHLAGKAFKDFKEKLEAHEEQYRKIQVTNNLQLNEKELVKTCRNCPKTPDLFEISRSVDVFDSDGGDGGGDGGVEGGDGRRMIVAERNNGGGDGSGGFGGGGLHKGGGGYGGGGEGGGGSGGCGGGVGEDGSGDGVI
ncbi:uncharacterized protein LOC135152838 [Daucus carota subsp. sativus]|uniref:uncharacterized protein LOC135152838 n=1 Tax=Daucus carota subsp. sativus TaxID=79200 RepID=UPI0030834966